MGKIETKKKLHQFRKERKDSRDVLRTKLFSEAIKVKRLDKHIEEFLKLIKKDAKKHNTKLLKKHADDFEKEINEELTFLMMMTHDDLKLYLKVLKSMQKFKTEIRKFSNKDIGFKKIAKAELKYAEAITKSAHHKIDSLYRLFKRLEKE